MKGQKIKFNITVTGAKKLSISFPEDIRKKDIDPITNIDIFKDMPVATLDEHEETYTYYVPLEAIERNGYKFTATAENDGMTATCDMFLNVKGSILDGIKTEIRY